MSSPDKKNYHSQVSETVKSKKVSCNGGGGALGHPKIYLDMGKENHSIDSYIIAIRTAPCLDSTALSICTLGVSSCFRIIVFSP